MESGQYSLTCPKTWDDTDATVCHELVFGCKENTKSGQFLNNISLSLNSFTLNTREVRLLKQPIVLWEWGGWSRARKLELGDKIPGGRERKQGYICQTSTGCHSTEPKALTITRLSPHNLLLIGDIQLITYLFIYLFIFLFTWDPQHPRGWGAGRSCLAHDSQSHWHCWVRCMEWNASKSCPAEKPPKWGHGTS